MANPMLSMMMNMLQSRNPQMFQMINQAKNNGTNPQDILKQMMGNATPEQMAGVMQQAKQFGVPDDVLKQFQNLK